MSDLETITTSEEKKSNFFMKLYNQSSKHINYKIGSLVGVIGGGVVYYINREHGFWPAAGGFGKQFFYNLFIAGFNIKTCEKLAKGIKSKSMSLVASTLVPTAQAFAITYLIHKLGGTPEAFDSTIWQVYLNIPTFLGFGIYYRKHLKS